jgi:hypothetical protein
MKVVEDTEMYIWAFLAQLSTAGSWPKVELREWTISYMLCAVRPTSGSRKLSEKGSDVHLSVLYNFDFTNYFQIIFFEILIVFSRWDDWFMMMMTMMTTMMMMTMMGRDIAYPTGDTVRFPNW